jgi:enoyl-CoA hydratase/carnithine racemase
MSETLSRPRAEAADEVLYEAEGGVAVITLNRPERMNTISGPMLAQLTELLLKANADKEVRAVILTGTGRAFCAGLDLVDATQGSGIGSEAQAAAPSVNLDLRNTPPTVLFAMDKPTICALNGAAAGYGMDTALGCDMRIMGESSKLAAAFVKRGVVPESGGTWFLPRLLGWAKAAEIIFTGRTLSAAQCLELGLANEVVPDAELMPRARAVAGADAARPRGRGGDRRQRAAGRAVGQAADAHGAGGDLQRPRAPRLPAVPAARPHPGLPGRNDLLPGEAAGELQRPLAAPHV